MTRRIEVECTHIADELMRVRFANSQIVSDHPKQWGGTETGPAPGEMILMALTAASALAGKKFALREGLDVRQIGSRAGMTSLQEGLPPHLRHIPLPHLTYADRFWRLIEVEGRLSEKDRDALIEAMAENSVALAIREGIQIDESTNFRRPEPGGRRTSGKGRGSELLKGRQRLAAGETRTASPGDAWLVSASALDGRTCVMRAAGACYVAGDDVDSRRGPTPEELLLGGLAACTCIYIARNACFLKIDLDNVSVTVTAELPDDPDQPIRRVEKISDITGELSDEEASQLRSIAEVCAFGLTLGKGTEIVDSLAITQADAAVSGGPGLMSIDRTAPAPNDPAYCTDGSCCIPVFERQPS